MVKSAPAVQDGVVIGNTFDKYRTRNPIARALMKGFVRDFCDLVTIAAPSTVHEVGCGEGELSMTLSRMGIAVRGSDFSSDIISTARQRADEAGEEIDFTVKDVYELSPPQDEAELVVCCEVLEHLPDPHRALRILTSLARPYLLVSVPREPVWRMLNMARGRYVRHLGNTPGHLNHWSKRSFLRFLHAEATPVEIRSPFPWTMVLCRPHPTPANQESEN